MFHHLVFLLQQGHWGWEHLTEGQLQQLDQTSTIPRQSSSIPHQVKVSPTSFGSILETKIILFAARGDVETLSNRLIQKAMQMQIIRNDS